MAKKYAAGNTTCVGSTRCGKSIAAVEKIVLAAGAGWSIVCIDPHSDSLSWKVLIQLLAHGHRKKILFDRLSDYQQVLRYQLMHRSEAKNPLQRDLENEQIIDHLTEIVGRRRGMANLATNPQTEEYTRLGFGLFIHQQIDPSPYLQDVFEPTSKGLAELIKGCTHEGTRQKFELIQSGKIRPTMYAAAARLLRRTIGSPLFQLRCGGRLDFDQFLDKQGILLVEGGGGVVSEDASQTILGTIIQRTIQFIRTRRKPTPRVLLILDEAFNAGLIGDAGHELRAMAECQKWGLDILTLAQTLPGSTSLQQQLLGNSVRHEWFFHASDSVARAAAADLGDPDYREKIRQLPVGGRWVKHLRDVYFVQGKMLPDPWAYPGLSEKKAEQFLEELKASSPYYLNTNLSAEELTACPTLNSPVSEMPRSSADATSTSVSSDISELSSPATRLHTDD